MNEIRKPSIFEEGEPDVPASSPPTFDQLSKQLTQRRRMKRAKLTTGISLAVIGMIAVVAMQREGDEFPIKSDSDPVRVAAANQDDSSRELHSHRESGIHLFASVRRSLPLFQIEEETQLLQHVGWIDTEGVVPVDLDGLSDDQQETLRAVLSEETESKFIYL